MAVYVLNAEPDVPRAVAIEQKLRTAIPDLIKIGNIEDALHGLQSSSGPSNLLLIGLSSDPANLDKLARLAARYRDRIFFVLIGGEISASEYKTLVRNGGIDWISAGADVQEILDLISNRQARSRIEATPVAHDAKRRAVSFVPSAGGVGNTTLAVEVGVTLKLGKPTRDMNICIVDLDFQSSHVCDSLDIEPRLKMQEISSNPERLDAQLFDIFISRHSSGLHVFAAPRSKTEPCDFSVVALDKLLDMISARYNLILIDMPLTWFSWTPQIVAASDSVVVTGVNTIPGLRQTAETLAAVRATARASAQIAVAVNRCRRRFWGGVAQRHHAERALGRENVFYIVEQPTALESVNTGTPMVLSKGFGAIGRDIAALAEFCAQVKPARVAPAV
ncbi:MAG TPA: AAA family ATPase [Xanthobacteraceae bacterium]|jgi:pilus assembly protein CpaE